MLVLVVVVMVEDSAFSRCCSAFGRSSGVVMSAGTGSGASARLRANWRRVCGRTDSGTTGTTAGFIGKAVADCLSYQRDKSGMQKIAVARQCTGAINVLCGLKFV